jgi:sugar fermentation stimulation protein A
MIYPDTCPAIFLTCPNRFIAYAELDGQEIVAHVKNTGRCKELLIPGVNVVLQKIDNPARKTGYDLIAVWKGRRLINMDSQAPNKVFREYLRSGRYMEGITKIKPEATYGGSRFDFYVEAGQRKAFIEVKGVTLEDDGVVLFPDAPTQRGIKHLIELAACIREGYEGHMVFVVQMNDVLYFAPNNKTHPAFGKALAAAAESGVNISAYDCSVTEKSMVVGNPVQIRLEPEETLPVCFQ